MHYAFTTCMCVCHVPAGAHGGRMMLSSPLGLELLIAMSHRVRTRNQTHVLSKSHKCFLTMDPSLQSLPLLLVLRKLVLGLRSVAQWVECLPSMCKVLSLLSNTTHGVQRYMLRISASQNNQEYSVTLGYEKPSL